MNILRFLMLLALAAWLGALLFFPVVAATAFSALPTSQMAGLVVRGSLLKLHAMGFICGAIFLVCSVIQNRVILGRIQAFGFSHIAILLMLTLTAISQFRIIPRMDALAPQQAKSTCSPQVNRFAPSLTPSMPGQRARKAGSLY